MKSMTELAGGELCLPQRHHNQVGAARRRTLSLFKLEKVRYISESVFCLLRKLS